MSKVIYLFSTVFIRRHVDINKNKLPTLLLILADRSECHRIAQPPKGRPIRISELSKPETAVKDNVGRHVSK